MWAHIMNICTSQYIYDLPKRGQDMAEYGGSSKRKLYIYKKVSFICIYKNAKYMFQVYRVVNIYGRHVFSR